MAEIKPIVIPASNIGIGSSPHTGFGDVRNLDLYTLPGVVRLNNLLAKKSSTTVTNTVQWLVRDPITVANIFALDAGGQVYKSADSGATWATVAGETSGGAGQGMQIWKDYLFVARTSALDVYGPISGSASWSNSWKTIDSDTLWHPMIVSKLDNKLYGGAGKYVFSIDELTTFAPGTSASFTWTQQALDLPSNYRIKCLEEQSNDLMIGTWMGSNIYDFKVADIFPWDRSSPSFKDPIRFNVNGINGMVNILNTLWVLAGIAGEVYITNGVQATKVGQIPSSIADIEGGKYLEFYPGAIVNYKDRPFFGVSVGGSGNISGMGIWSIKQTSKGNILTNEHSISTGSDGTSSVVKIGALLSLTRDTILCGWKDGTSYGIDLTTNTERYTTYLGYAESPFYTVGTNLNKRQFTQIEFLLAKPLTTGQGIKLKYRTDLNASWTTIGTYDYATLGGILSHNDTPGIPACEAVQIRYELTTGSSSNTSPQLKSVTLK